MTMKFSTRIALSLMLSAGYLGTASAETITLDARAFQPQYKDDTAWTESSAGSLICTAGIGIFAAQLRLPRASIIKQVSAWGGDTSATQDAQINLVRVCQPEAIAASPTPNTLLTIFSDSSGGAYYTTGALNEPSLRGRRKAMVTFSLSSAPSSSNTSTPAPSSLPTLPTFVASACHCQLWASVLAK
jgi:hypothetical protein